MPTPSLSQLIEPFLTHMAAGNAAQGTLELRRHQLHRLVDSISDCSIGDVTADDLARYLTSKGWSPATMKSVRSAVSRFFAWAHGTGRIPTNPAAELPSCRLPTYHPRPAPEWAIQQALSTADDRVALMIQLAYQQGLRRGEIARVHTDDLVGDADGWSLRVHGKGGRERIIPLRESIAKDLATRPRGWVFPHPQGPGPLSAQHVGKLITNSLATGFSTHTLRHRFASQVYAETKDLLAVKELLGHASVATTQIYTQVPGQWLRDAVNAID